ncbi:hypothetical protein CK203_030469 [Vitis vinifera]|uniref:Uncharacterized protein n=1 Tax=Vitis vinifera TaxID=29760 RepID=A0A438JDN4_VITVI|nr:hypothetical protein CK203_030469 [Vitis vinifera]
MEEAKTMKTPMSSSIKLDMDEKGKPVNSTMYRGMIGLWYPKGDNFELIGYSDADFAGCKVERKSTSGTCHFLGHSLVSWHSGRPVKESVGFVGAENLKRPLHTSFLLFSPLELATLHIPASRRLFGFHFLRAFLPCTMRLRAVQLHLQMDPGVLKQTNFARIHGEGFSSTKPNQASVVVVVAVIAVISFGGDEAVVDEAQTLTATVI